MNSSPATTTAASTALAPSHAEIEHCARDLWTAAGQPEGRDEEFWLEAERRLISAQRSPLPAAEIPRSRVRSRARGQHAGGF